MYTYTAREVYINILTELVKEESPILYLEDYLYFYNKAISEYMKTRYELFETNQQLADDMRSWKKQYSSDSLTVVIDNIGDDVNPRFHYRHLLGCTIDVKTVRPNMRCEQSAGETKTYKVVRMSSDIKNGILNNEYLSAQFYRPYFEILDNEIKINVGNINTKSVIISNIVIEYLKQPKEVVLTDEMIDVEADTSEKLEFSKDVCDEITKIALKLILERGRDQRLQSHVAVNQAISDTSTGMKSSK